MYINNPGHMTKMGKFLKTVKISFEGGDLHGLGKWAKY